MRWSIPICLTVLSLVASSAMGQGVDAAARKEIDAERAKVVQAFKDGSARSLLKECTPDFTWKPAAGTPLDRKKGDVPFRLALTAKHVVDLTLKTQKVSMAGLDIQAVDASKEVAEMQDRDGKYGQKNGRVQVTSTGTIRETWAKTPQGWRLKFWEELPGAKVTSKPLQSQGPPR